MIETVLKFLYENRQSLKYNNINHLLVDKRPIDVRYFIRELVENKFVLMSSNKYDMLGNGNPTIGLDTVELKAKIRSQGEQYYLDTYMKKNETNTFNVDQLISVGGDNHAPISQTKGHSSSSIEMKVSSPIMHPPKTLIQTLLQHKTIVTIISTVVGGLFLYLLTEFIKRYL